MSYSSLDLRNKRASVAVEYILVSMAILIALAAFKAGSSNRCMNFQTQTNTTGNLVNERCESTFDQMSDAMSATLSEVTLLLQLPL